MSLQRPLLLSLYWGGQIIIIPQVGASYSPPVANHTVVIHEKLTYDQLIDMICGVASIDKNIFKLTVIFRQPYYVGGGVMYNATKIVTDGDMAIIYNSTIQVENSCVELFLETELISSIMHPSNLAVLPAQSSFVQLLNNIPHMNSLSTHSPSFDVATLPLCSVSSSNSGPSAILGMSPVLETPICQLTCQANPKDSSTPPSIERAIIPQPDRMVSDDFEMGRQNPRTHRDDHVNIELNECADIVVTDRAGQQDASSSPSCTEQESVGYDDIGSDSSDSANDGGNRADVMHDVGGSQQNDRQLVRSYTPPGLAYFNNLGTASETDPTDRGETERIHVWSESNAQIRLGMRFEDKAQLKKAIAMWSIRQNREFRVVESKSNTWAAKCKWETRERSENSRRPMISCLWCVRAVLKSTHGMWQITKWVTEHNCIGANQANHHPNLTSAIVATHVMHAIQVDPCYAVKNVQKDIKKSFKVDISYKTAWHGRRRAIELVYGAWEESFADLPKYMEALQRSNPGTVVQWLHHPASTDNVKIFKYVFWAFAPAVEAFHTCRPVVSVDGTHLRGAYKGKLLVAVTHDANNCVLPLAFAIVDEETVQSWGWFMEQFRMFVASDRFPLCILSDRHKGIINAMTNMPEWKEPIAYHRFCLRHVRSNFMTKFRNARLKRLVWSLGSARQKRKWKNFRTELRSLSTEGWEYLKAIDRSQWCLAYDRNFRWGTLTTNVSESYNNVLRGARHLPIKACVDATFHRTVQMFKDRVQEAYHCRYDLPPNIWKKFRKYDVVAQGHEVMEFDYADGVYKVVTKNHVDGKGGHTHTVKYYKHVCSCGKWQMYRLPCSHALAVCRLRRDNPYLLVHQVYTVDTYVDQYSGKFVPLPHPDYWPRLGWQLQPDDSRFISQRYGRHRVSRIQNEMDETHPGEPPRCSTCHQVGHNRRSCPNSQPRV